MKYSFIRRKYRINTFLYTKVCSSFLLKYTGRVTVHKSYCSTIAAALMSRLSQMFTATMSPHTTLQASTGRTPQRVSAHHRPPQDGLLSVSPHTTGRHRTDSSACLRTPQTATLRTPQRASAHHRPPQATTGRTADRSWRSLEMSLCSRGLYQVDEASLAGN